MNKPKHAYDDSGNYLSLVDRLQRVAGHQAWATSTEEIARLSPSALLQEAAAEIARLQEAKRRALAIADERSKENVALRTALKPFAAIALLRDSDPMRSDMIDAPDLAITPSDVRRAREALGK